MHVNPERLRAAWERARRGSKAAGIDGITPDLFAGVAEEQLNQLARLLAQERYCPQPTLGVPIRKRGGRQRLLGIATVQDRIVQRWLLRALYPALEEALSPASYAYRPGCSIHQAVGTLRAYWKPWLLKADIAQFFDALAWPVLLAALDDLALDPPCSSSSSSTCKRVGFWAVNSGGPPKAWRKAVSYRGRWPICI
jgi:retron-type reverse transcriptase